MYKSKQVHMSIQRILHWMLMINLILNCHSVYEHGMMNYHFNIACCLFILIIAIPYKRKINKRYLYAMFLYIAFSLPLAVLSINNHYMITFLVKYVFFCITVILAISQNQMFLEDSIKIYVYIMYIICLISLFFFVLATALKYIPPTGSYFLKWSNMQINSYFGLYFETSHGRVFDWENSAIFTESPVFAALIGTALAFELFHNNDKIRKYRVVIFVITLLTTFSSTGTIAIILIALGQFYVYSNKTNICVIKMLAKLTIFVGGFVAILLIMNILYEKSLRGYSFMARLEDLRTALRVVRDKPLFGVGFGNENYNNIYSTVDRSNWASGKGQSSDFAMLLAQGGLYYMAFYLISLFHMIKWRNDRYNFLVCTGLVLFIFLISRIGATLLLLLFISCGYCYLINKQRRI